MTGIHLNGDARAVLIILAAIVVLLVVASWRSK